MTETQLAQGFEQDVQFLGSEHPDLVFLNEVSVKFDGMQKPVLDKLTLRVEQLPDGRKPVIAIMGASGCGKSTILNILAGLLTQTSGKVFLNGKEGVGGGSVGMVFQKYSSFYWQTVLENVAFPLMLKGVAKKQREATAREFIKLMGLSEHENKYAKQAGAGKGGLSGGQMQRVALARALVYQPELLLLDEAFGALDVATREKMQLLLLSVQRQLNFTVLMVTHDESEAVFLADEVWVMKANPGQIVSRYKVPFTEPRTVEMKRDPRGIELVGVINQKIRELNSL